MDPIEKALLGTGGDQAWILDALSHPVATVLMWVVPIGIELAAGWYVVNLIRRRRALAQAALWEAPPVVPRPRPRR